MSMAWADKVKAIFVIVCVVSLLFFAYSSWCHEWLGMTGWLMSFVMGGIAAEFAENGGL